MNDIPLAPEGTTCTVCGAPAKYLYDDEPVCPPHFYAVERANE